jgi:hypothetical protein
MNSSAFLYFLFVVLAGVQNVVNAAEQRQANLRGRSIVTSNHAQPEAPLEIMSRSMFFQDHHRRLVEVDPKKLAI